MLIHSTLLPYVFSTTGPSPEPPKSKTKLYIGLGVGLGTLFITALGVVAFMIIIKKRGGRHSYDKIQNLNRILLFRFFLKKYFVCILKNRNEDQKSFKRCSFS